MVLALRRVAPQGLGGPSIIASDRVYPFGIASLNDRSSRAIDAFSQGPLSRASRPFTGPILKGSKGSDMIRSPCRQRTAAICAKRATGVDVRERETGGKARELRLFQDRRVPAFGEGADQRGKPQRSKVTPFVRR
jgi:hypothetical protein